MVLPLPPTPFPCPEGSSQAQAEEGPQRFTCQGTLLCSGAKDLHKLVGAADTALARASLPRCHIPKPCQAPADTAR